MQRLVIHRPIRSSTITQGFGENRACKNPNTGKVTSTRDTCPPGTVPFYQSFGLQGHTGIDIRAISGETVYHGGTFDGWMKTEKDPDGGIGVDVISNAPLFFPGNPPRGLEPVQRLQDGFTSYVKLRYWHLKSPIGFDKKPVKYGQEIGLADNTGNSSGDHLHFAAKWCDRKGVGINAGNGYAGSFDFTPNYKNTVFAKDSAEMLEIRPVLTEKEVREVQEQLTLIKRALLLLRELVYKL